MGQYNIKGERRLSRELTAGERAKGGQRKAPFYFPTPDLLESYHDIDFNS
ncbi:MAG: hypothetical protein M1299_08330 [Firmicutes bacterium]|nr:hypothetical protein [Bacillota bacterium]